MHCCTRPAYRFSFRVWPAATRSSRGTVNSTRRTAFFDREKMTISGRWVVTAISGGKTSWLSPKSKRNSQSLELSNRSFEEDRGWRLWWLFEYRWVEQRVDREEAEPAGTKRMYGWVERFARSLMVLWVSGDCQNDKSWVTFVSSSSRERDACDVNRYHAEIASDHAYDYLHRA